MKRIKVDHESGHTEPCSYYKVFVYPALNSKKPEFHSEETCYAKEEVDDNIPLGIVMGYLHHHPLDETVLDDETDDYLRSKLQIIIQAHNASVSKLKKLGYE